MYTKEEDKISTCKVITLKFRFMRKIILTVRDAFSLRSPYKVEDNTYVISTCYGV